MRLTKHPTRTHFFYSSLLVLSVLALIAAASLYGPRMGRFVWAHLHVGALATLLDPHDATLDRDIGVYNFSSALYRLSTAQRYFERALALDPHLSYCHFELARIAFIEGKLSVALVEADKEEAIDPSLAQVYYLRGLVYAYAGSLDPAISQFKTFLTKKPESWAGHNDLAWVYFREGDFADSALYAEEGLTYAPGNPWLENTAGTALLNLGRYVDARAHLLAARAGFGALTPAKWGGAYPGNDPRVYAGGLASSRQSVLQNLALLAQKLEKP